MGNLYDYECSRCARGYDHGDGKFSKQLDEWVCEECFYELSDQAD